MERDSRGEKGLGLVADSSGNCRRLSRSNGRFFVIQRGQWIDLDLPTYTRVIEAAIDDVLDKLE